MKRKLVRSALAGLAALALISAACSSPGSKPADEFAGITQFVANPSFEELDGALPKGWKTADWRGGAAFAVADAGHEGGRSVTISSPDGADASWITTVPIRPYAEYRLSGWIKTEALEPGTGRGAQINVNGAEAWRTPAVSGTRDWTKVEVEFDAGANDALEITCLFGGWGKSSGRARFDDVRLDLVKARELGPPRVAIAADKVRAPISKYVYGQFIEHLGRCIYQGIWAEMREGREILTLSVVNPTRRPQTLKLDFGPLRVPRTARLSLIAGDDPQAYNKPGVPPAVVIREIGAAPFGRTITVPPVSVSLYEIAVH